MNKSWMDHWGLKSSIFWRNYLLNLFLLFGTLAICFESARAILPAIEREEHKTITEATVDRLANQVLLIMDELQHLTESVKTNPAFLSNDIKLLDAELKTITTYSPLTDNAAIFDKQGNIITSTPKNENELNNVSLRSYFAEPMKTKAAYLSPVFFTKSGQPVIVLGIPIIDTEQEVERIVGLRIELLQNQMMQSFFEHFDIGENGYTYIVDQNGRVLFHPQKERIAEDVNENAVVKELMQGNSGYQKVTNLQGSNMLASYRFIPYLHWGIVAQIPVESTLFSLEAFEDRIEKLALLLLLPLMILVGLHTRRTIEPIKRLQKAVGEVTNGNYDGHIPTNGKNEIEVLFQQFNNMVDTIRQNRKNLNLKRQELLE
ncbi:MAG TPA: cache and HAMP domain-containing protein, partial [Bacillota bacterium]|nr:cache and HAMP domain-containing protein [Bacillota bacterium]